MSPKNRGGPSSSLETLKKQKDYTLLRYVMHLHVRTAPLCQVRRQPIESSRGPGTAKNASKTYNSHQLDSSTPAGWQTAKAATNSYNTEDKLFKTFRSHKQLWRPTLTNTSQALLSCIPCPCCWWGYYGRGALCACILACY